MTKDYYKILGIAEFETAENIKTAYRKLVRKCHPDIVGNSSEALERFKDINEAYEILSNEVKRNEYDRAKRFYDYAHQTKSQSNVNYNKQNSSNPNREKKQFNFRWEDFLGKNYKESIFKEREIKAPKKGENLNADVEITAYEAINGISKVLNILQTEVCPLCNGKKFVNGGKCSACQGKGEFVDYKKFTVKIPAGIKSGSKIRLAGEGGKGVNGGDNGDLYITVHVNTDSNFKMADLNILKTVAITPFDAVLGGEISLSTHNGKVNLKIAPNTQNGQKIRLAGCGLVQNNKIGDMIVVVEIKIPEKLSQEEIDLYQKLKEISQDNNRTSE